MILFCSITPPVRRKPCVGRNIEDSDADLYAEYHGNDNSVFTDPSSSTLGPRQRSSSKRQNQEPKRKLFTNQPDLSGSINTNFSLLSNSNQPLSSLTPSPLPDHTGFDFNGQFSNIYSDHQRFLEENDEGIFNHGDGDLDNHYDEWRSRSWSAGKL
jgi:hypothetical protein